jgi:hypothetical protein
MNDRPPILNIPAVDPFNPQPVIGRMRFGEPKQVEGKFGTQYMYGLEVNGQAHTLFASKALDAAIYETGAQQNDYIAIIRTGEGKDTRWQVRLVDENGQEIKGAGRSIKEAKPAERLPSPEPAAPKPKLTAEERQINFVSDEDQYFSALARARHRVKDWPIADGNNIDLNAVAFVLYKMAKEHGVTLIADGSVLNEADVPF